MPTHLDHIEFAENPDPRCPCVLLLDVSASMQGESIAALNEGLKAFQREVSGDTIAAIDSPCIEAETSSSSTQGHRGSGFSANSMWSRCVGMA